MGIVPGCPDARGGQRIEDAMAEGRDKSSAQFWKRARKKLVT
jgi:hypothetical protein